MRLAVGVRSPSPARQRSPLGCDIQTMFCRARSNRSNRSVILDQPLLDQQSERIDHRDVIKRRMFAVNPFRCKVLVQKFAEARRWRIGGIRSRR